jgi:probable rRNA maturation factor
VKSALPPRRLSLGSTIAVQIASTSPDVPSAASLRRWARLAMGARGEITLRVVDTAEGRRLNRGFRRRDYATNVLSFAYARAARRDGPQGDIVLCHPVIAREARAQRKTLGRHYAHLVIHGVLHLRGLEHARSAARQRMERREIALLARLGVPNPYVVE